MNLNYALVTLLVLPCIGLAADFPPPGECPQPRFTGKAPATVYKLENPLSANNRNLKAGKRFYEKGTQPSCASCHGSKGDGKGAMASMFNPPPRNFACSETVNGIPDGQLYWIIKNGSPGTSMPDHRGLSDEELWQLVLYIRELSH